MTYITKIKHYIKKCKILFSIKHLSSLRYDLPNLFSICT